MATIYFDTSFFIGLIENQAGRQDMAKTIILFEERNKSTTFHTSVLTVTEFLVGIYDRYHDDDDCEDRVADTIKEIQQIATLAGLSEAVARRAARIESAWGRAYGQLPDKERDPRLRKRRWDAIHLATAGSLGATRVYAWDDKWQDVPDGVIGDIGEIISPAVCPQPELPAPVPEPDESEPSSALPSDVEQPDEFDSSGEVDSLDEAEELDEVGQPEEPPAEQSDPASEK